MERACRRREKQERELQIFLLDACGEDVWTIGQRRCDCSPATVRRVIKKHCGKWKGKVDTRSESAVKNDTVTIRYAIKRHLMDRFSPAFRQDEFRRNTVKLRAALIKALAELQTVED